MSKISLVFLLSALSLAMLAFAYLSPQGQAGDGNHVLFHETVTATPRAIRVELWDQFCAKKIPYTLLALPENASFEIIQPETALPTLRPAFSNSNEIACVRVGIFRGQQVVVCRGSELHPLSIQVSDSGMTEEFDVPLKACPSPEKGK